MSLAYNGSTSTFLSDAGQTVGSLYSGAAWIKATTQGQGNSGCIMGHSTANFERFFFSWDASAGSKKLAVWSLWNGGLGKWVMTTGFSAITPWLWVGFTYDAGATTNDPIVYTLVDSTFSTLTVGSGLTEANTPVGVLPADTQTFGIGNISGGGFTWDGLIGESAFWKAIRTPSEMEAIAFNGVNVCPDHFNYLPQDGGSVQNLGSSGTAFTASNTAVGENPPIRPAGRRG